MVICMVRKVNYDLCYIRNGACYWGVPATYETLNIGWLTVFWNKLIQI